MATVTSISAALPQIHSGADVHRVCHEIAEALARSDKLVYQRSGDLVLVAQSGPKHPLSEGSPILRPMTVAALLPRVSAACTLIGKQGSPIDAPGTLLGAILQRADHDPIPHLLGVTESPFLRHDGTVCQSRGYDKSSGVLFLPRYAYPTIPEKITRDMARAVLAELRDVFADFPFASEVSAYVVISAILSIQGRYGILGPVPAHLFDASTVGSGKTMQCDVAHLIATGRVPAHANWPIREEEQEKLLGAIALAAPQAVVIDNVKGVLGGSAIEQTLTSTSVQFRILGATSLRSFDWRSIVLVSGNNIALTDDMIRRTLMGRLESPLEDPTTRTDFRHPELLDWVTEHRPHLATLGMIVLSGYAQAKWPDPPKMASYSQWARVVAGAILWAGGEDVTKAVSPRERAALDDSGAAAQIVSMWPTPGWSTLKAILQTQYPVPKSDEPPRGSDDLRDAFESLAPAKGPAGPAPSALGKKLSKFKGRWFGERRITCRQDPKTKTMTWCVESRSEAELAGGAGGKGYDLPRQNNESEKNRDYTSEPTPRLPPLPPPDEPEDDREGAFDDLLNDPRYG
jgi:hypothetical protein